MSFEEDVKSNQLAIKVLTFEDRLILAKSLKRAIETASNIEEKRYYKIRIRELFTNDEWDKLVQEKTKGEN